MRKRDDFDENTMSEDEIDENLEESFPASDPPSWNLGTNHSASKARDESDENEDRE